MMMIDNDDNDDDDTYNDDEIDEDHEPLYLSTYLIIHQSTPSPIRLSIDNLR